MWGGEEILIVVSSDLSHYLPYAIAQREDSKAIAFIFRLHQAIDHEHACGATPIDSLTVVAQISQYLSAPDRGGIFATSSVFERVETKSWITCRFLVGCGQTVALYRNQMARSR